MELITKNLPVDSKVRFGLLDMHDDVVKEATPDQIAFLKRIRRERHFWRCIEDFVALKLSVTEFLAFCEVYHAMGEVLHART